MNVLVLGGTQFVGRHVVESLVRAGHPVTLFNRGRSRDELPESVERLRGDRDLGPAGLAALAGRRWDACVDVSGYTARHVRSSAEILRDNVDRYVFISAVAVYGDPPRGPVAETEPRVAPAGEEVNEIDRDTYGPLKVTCENIVEDLFGERCAMLRPQIVAGPHDPFDRFSYWVHRAGERGDVLAPGDGSDHLQYIDAGDLARFTQVVCERGLDGPFNLAGPRLTWADFVTMLGVRTPVWVRREIIDAAGVTEFELPLYRPDGGPRSSLMHVSNERTVAAGLELTEPATTIEAVRHWLHGQDRTPALSPAREAELIEKARATQEST